MSSNLYWEPEERESFLLSKELKNVLHRYLDTAHIDRVFNSDHIDIFNALDAAGISGAKDVIDAINKYGSIRLTEKF